MNMTLIDLTYEVIDLTDEVIDLTGEITDFTGEMTDLTKKESPNLQCDICFNSIENDNEQLNLRCCNYSKNICIDCAHKWFEENETDTCPFCKKSLDS